MPLISNIKKEDFIQLQNSIFEEIKKCETLEQAAQKYTSLLYKNFSESIVLCRLFVTQKFDELPDTNRKFVMKLAASSSVTEIIKDKTIVLSLLGTQGVNPEWNNRCNSIGHIGIPLASSAFVEKIPMISRLLKALNLGLEWIDSNDNKIILKTIGNLSGVFYVSDAKTEVDNKGRLIIPAQDFVDEYSVKSVLGVGGGYMGNPTFFNIVIFLRESIPKKIAEHFMLHASKFKASTINHVENAKIFTFENKE